MSQDIKTLLDEFNTALADLVAAVESGRMDARSVVEAIKALRLQAPAVTVNVPEMTPVVHVMPPQASATFHIDITYGRTGLPESMKITRS